MLSDVSDSAGPLDQSEGMACQPIELPRVALASGVLQCAVKLLRNVVSGGRNTKLLRNTSHAHSGLSPSCIVA
jgi:hypothetical protein